MRGGDRGSGWWYPGNGMVRTIVVHRGTPPGTGTQWHYSGPYSGLQCTTVGLTVGPYSGFLKFIDFFGFFRKFMKFIDFSGNS